MARDGRHISSWPLHTSCVRACVPGMTGGIIDIHLLSHEPASKMQSNGNNGKRSRNSPDCAYTKKIFNSRSRYRVRSYAYRALPPNDNIYPSTEPSRHIHHRIYSLESALRAQRVAILHRNRPIARRALSSGPCLP